MDCDGQWSPSLQTLPSLPSLRVSNTKGSFAQCMKITMIVPFYLLTYNPLPSAASEVAEAGLEFQVVRLCNQDTRSQCLSFQQVFFDRERACSKRSYKWHSSWAGDSVDSEDLRKENN